MSKTTMSKNEIEQKIRDLKTKLSCQESDIGDWKIAKCIEYSTLGMESPYDLQELHKQRQVIRDEIGALEEELAKCEDEDEAASEKQALFTKLLSKKAEGFSLRFVLINTGNISRKVLSKVLRSFDKNFERLHKPMDNKQIRVVMRDNNIYMWQVAKKLNVNETSFCKWFREELSEERKQQVMSAIEEIKLDRLKEQK